MTRLRRRIDAAIVASAGTARASVSYLGPLSVVGAAVAPHLEAVVPDTVSNAVGRPGATACTVTVTVEHDVVIEVAGNGRRTDREAASSELTAARRRADALGGTFAVQRAQDGGTSIVRCAPLP
jgi:two-component system sensor histidine kinase DevS